MLGLNISCSSKSTLARVWPVRIRKLYNGWDVWKLRRGVVHVIWIFCIIIYNLLLSLYVHFICISVFYVWRGAIERDPD